MTLEEGLWTTQCTKTEDGLVVVAAVAVVAGEAEVSA